MSCKKCIKCGSEKPIDQFYRQERMADGHLNKCKECVKQDARRHYAANVERYREYERSRASLPHRIAARQQYQQTKNGKQAADAAKRRYIARNPDKRAAVNAVNNAVRDGKLSKTPCVCCGAKTVHGHHEDYSKPLDVIWLCPACHSWWHKTKDAVANG